MKYQLTFILLAFFSFAQAQKDVSVEIAHIVDGVNNPFSKNTIYSSTNNGTFSFERFEYYLSSFKITHDGGQEITVPNFYALVDASNGNRSINLGSQNVTNIEKIEFYVGIDSVTNHADPAQYASGHPLAPQSPSMHWGWASGYRFVALEGLSDLDNDGTPEAASQFHAVGDQYFTPVSLTLPAAAVSSSSNSATIYVQFDLDPFLNNVQQGVLSHGASLNIDTLMGNIVDFPVFTVDTTTLTSNTINTPTVDYTWIIMPNPTADVLVVNYTNLDLGSKSSLILTDALGRVILEERIDNQANLSSMSLQGYPNGHYQLSIYTNGSLLTSKKLQIQH